MANKDPVIAKRNIVKRWRKKKNLCVFCGKDIHMGSCKENYKKTDNRDIIIISKEPDEDKRKETILNYRKKKHLCLSCGKDKHSESCSENFEKSDMRTEEEKTVDPRIVPTPKYKEDMDVEPNNINLVQTQKPKYIRDYVLMDINPTTNGERIEFTDVRYIAKKYSDLIICLIGSIEKTFAYSNVLKLKKINNITELGKRCTDQDIVNHIMSCIHFISFRTKYTAYAKYHLVSCTVLKKDDNVRNVLMRLPKQWDLQHGQD